ncbi:MAG: hypothetical protein ACNA71_07985 [Kiritimatiellia bacterium]
MVTTGGYYGQGTRYEERREKTAEDDDEGKEEGQAGEEKSPDLIFDESGSCSFLMGLPPSGFKIGCWKWSLVEADYFGFLK